MSPKLPQQKTTHTRACLRPARAGGRQAFTLVETLVAITILTVALIPIILIATQSISSASQSRNQMIASYLVQDAMDFIIAKKNENIIQCKDVDKESKCNSSGNVFGEDWLADMRDCIVTGAGNNRGCMVNTDRTVGLYTVICPSAGCPFMFYDTSKGTYGHTTGVPTVFKRTVKFMPFTGSMNDGMAVEVVVSWKGSGFKVNNDVKLKTNIYNFKP